MDSLYLIIFFILGTVLGGFYTVLGGRLAEEDYHFFPYRCNHCKHKLSVLEVFPMISYFILRGKCKHCGKKISILSVINTP